MSLSVLFFILVYVLSCILSAYSPDYDLQVNRSLCFLLLDPLVSQLVIWLFYFLSSSMPIY